MYLMVCVNTIYITNMFLCCIFDWYLSIFSECLSPSYSLLKAGKEVKQLCSQFQDDGNLKYNFNIFNFNLLYPCIILDHWFSVLKCWRWCNNYQTSHGLCSPQGSCEGIKPSLHYLILVISINLDYSIKHE